MSTKSHSRPGAPAPESLSTMALIGAIYENDGDRSVREVLARADDALAWGVTQADGLIDVMTSAAERLNRSARAEGYDQALKAFESAITGPAGPQHGALEAAGRVRGEDVEAAFAIGLAAGLRLAGGGR